MVIRFPSVPIYYGRYMGMDRDEEGERSPSFSRALWMATSTPSATKVVIIGLGSFLDLDSAIYQTIWTRIYRIRVDCRTW